MKKVLGLLALSTGMLLTGRAEASAAVIDVVSIEMPEHNTVPESKRVQPSNADSSNPTHKDRAKIPEAAPAAAIRHEAEKKHKMPAEANTISHSVSRERNHENEPDTRELLREMNSGIAAGIRIKGKSGHEAAVSVGTGNDRKSYIVELDDEGHAVSARESQEGYDAIVYGGRNELSWVQIAEMNSRLSSHKQKGQETIGQAVLKASQDTSTLLRQIKKEAIEASLQEAGLADSEMMKKAISNEMKVDEAFRINDGRVSPFGRLGCADTAVVAGAYYNKDLREEALNGTAYVPTLRRHLEDKGYICEEFNGYAKKGDLLIYGDDEHVVISDGKGGCFGNSSSQGHAMRFKDAYNAWYNNTPPTKVIRMS